MGFDESGCYCKGKLNRSWIAQTAYLTLVFRGSGRGAKVLEDRFGNSLKNMVAVTDRHSAYFAIDFLNNQVCLAHLLRNLEYLNDIDKNQRWAQEVKSLLREAIHERNEKPAEMISAKSWLERLDGLLKKNLDHLRKEFNELKRGLIKCRNYIFNFLVVVGYYTGGRAFAQYMGNAGSNTNVEQKTKSLEKNINASLVYKGDSLNGSFGFNGKDGTFDSTVYKRQDIFIRVKTLGGIQDETGVVNTTMALKDININLQSWRKSLNDSKNHTVIDLIEEGLYPMSDFVLERNFQRRFDDTSKEILLPVTRLYTPSITIARVLAKTSVSGESLYDVAAVLTTRQGDQIVLSKSNTTDAELRQNEDDNIFIKKAQIISSEISRYFSSDIQISYNTRKRINPQMRSPLCMVLENFNEKGFYKYYHEATNMEYLYDPITKLCFSFFADERDESLLEVYGLSSWAFNLSEKQISIATLANLYTIIGL